MILSKLKEKKWALYSAGVLAVVAVAAGATHHILRERRRAKPVSLYAWRLPSGAIFLAEDFYNPHLHDYRQKEHLDEVIQPYKKDFEQILALAHWASTQFQATTPFPHYPPWNGPIILDRIRKGKTGGFCAQYAFVFGQACQSVGYIPRYLDLASPENTSGHFTTEVYVPSLKKWVVFEPEWGIYYTDKEGHPLSALELHEWATGRRKDPYFEMPKRAHEDPSWVRLFYFFRYYLRNNFLSVPVFVRHDGEQLGFEPYRLIWHDPALTVDPHFLTDAIPSADAGDFQFAIRTETIPEFTWQNQQDFYRTMNSQPAYQLCKIQVPHGLLVKLIKEDLVNNPVYHRLRA